MSTIKKTKEMKDQPLQTSKKRPTKGHATTSLFELLAYQAKDLKKAIEQARRGKHPL